MSTDYRNRKYLLFSLLYFSIDMAVKDLLNELVKGYRLEQPPFANKRM